MKKFHSLRSEFHSILTPVVWKFTTQRVESRPVHSIFTTKEVITDVTPQGVTSVTNRVKIHSIYLESTFTVYILYSYDLHVYRMKHGFKFGANVLRIKMIKTFSISVFFGQTLNSFHFPEIFHDLSSGIPLVICFHALAATFWLQSSFLKDRIWFSQTFHKLICPSLSKKLFICNISF